MCFVLELVAGSASDHHFNHDIHAHPCLFPDSFNIMGPLISWKMIVRYAWHCIISPTVLCELAPVNRFMLHSYDPGILRDTHSGSVLGFNFKGNT